MNRRICIWMVGLILAFCGLTSGQVESKCGFSKYNYFWIDHFLPGGVVASVVPKYPSAARAVGASGTVQVDVIVDKKGHVRDACAVTGHPLLRASAVRAAKAFTFRPNFGLSTPQKRTRRYIKTELIFSFHWPS